jgi:small subunit ribosomal protein S20
LRFFHPDKEAFVPNTRSAKKMVRVAERRRQRNRSVRSAVRTFVRKAERAIVVTADDTLDQVKSAIRALDKAATKGVIHRNNASRRKSRLMKKYITAQKATAATE